MAPVKLARPYSLLLVPSPIDPGAVGAGVVWPDTSTTPAMLRVRDATDTGWTVVGPLAPAVPVLRHITFPFAFDTPGLVPQHFAITAVDQGAKTFTIAGDHTALFPNASSVEVRGSTGNDRLYTLNGAAALVGGNTVITTNEAIPDPTADGTIVDDNTSGVVAWTPASTDDVLQEAFFSVTTAWDGTTPFADVHFQSGADSFKPNQVDLTKADAVTPNGGGIWGGVRTTTYSQQHVFPVRPAGLADVLRLVVSSGDGSNEVTGGSDPGSTHGAAVLHLLILPAGS